MKRILHLYVLNVEPERQAEKLVYESGLFLILSAGSLGLRVGIPGDFINGGFVLRLRRFGRVGALRCGWSRGFTFRALLTFDHLALEIFILIDVPHLLVLKHLGTLLLLIREELGAVAK